MPGYQQQSKRSIGWMGLQRGHRAKPMEWVAERFIFAISLSAIVLILLIFLFVAGEALPILLGRMDNARSQKVIPVADIGKTSPAELQAYLGLTADQYARMDTETVKALLEVKAEEASDAAGDKDAGLNTTSWRYLILPHRWTDYSRPVYIWQPVSDVEKYNIVPLIIGSLKATIVALLFSVPLALGAAIYVSQLASPRMREVLKPAIELLAGIPSVVLGFFALMVMASVLQRVFGYQSRLNMFVAGIALGLAVVPLVFSVAEDALTSVPRSYAQAALALGSSRWQAAWKIVLPAAIPGVFAAVVLGFGRAVGETMVVLMASGNADVMSWSLFDSARTVTATIAGEMGEVVVGSPHYRVLFMLGTLLFIVTFASNLAAELVINRLRQRLEGRA
jgi:phosphate transport system permease protein